MAETTEAGAPVAGQSALTTPRRSLRGSSWLAGNPIGAVALALGVIQLLVRLEVASSGWFYIDDLRFLSEAAVTPMSVEYLMQDYNGHLLPGAFIWIWLLEKAGEFPWWAVVVTTLAAQAVVSWAVYRLLVEAFGRVLFVIPLFAWFLFTPLTLVPFSWWSVAVTGLPLQAAGAGMLLFHIRYVRTREPRWVVASTACLVGGLLFFEKATLLVPFVVLLTAAVLLDGPIRGRLRELARLRTAWVAYAVVFVVYVSTYLAIVSFRPAGARDLEPVGQLLARALGDALLPAAVGGPWTWFPAGAGSGLAAPPAVAKWISWCVVVALVLVTLARSRLARGPWVALAFYLAMDIGLIVVGRLQTSGALAGLEYRYFMDAAVPIVLCAGYALTAVPDQPHRFRLPPPLDQPWGARAATGVVTGALVLSCLISTTTWRDVWEVKPGREYVANATEDFAAAGDDAVLYEGVVPADVQWGIGYPYNRYDLFFAPLDHPPAVRTIVPDRLPLLDATGRLRDGAVEGGARNLPGPIPGCGWQVTPLGRQIPLDTELFDFVWTARFAYLVNADTPAVITFDGTDYPVQLRRGLNAVYLQLVGGGSDITVSGLDEGINLCTDEIQIGNPVGLP